MVAALSAFPANRGISAQPPPAVSVAPPAAPKAASDDPTGDLLEAAKQLFDANAPPEIKQQFEFPSRAQLDAFLVRLQAVLDGNSFEDVAAFEPQARAALAVLESTPELADDADWLRSKLDDMDAARAIASQLRREPKPPASPAPPPRTPGVPAGEKIPYLASWIQRIRSRPPPARAGALIPELRRAFAREGVPPELAWIAEAESSFNPNASNPSGARGLFQLRPATARELGLSTFLPDQRLDPEPSALAAARQLRGLRERLGSWPLALAAYNAGEGRVRRALAARGATDFAGASPALSVETRMYVPKVLALVDVRGGVAPGSLPPPR